MFLKQISLSQLITNKILKGLPFFRSLKVDWKKWHGNTGKLFLTWKSVYFLWLGIFPWIFSVLPFCPSLIPAVLAMEVIIFWLKLIQGIFGHQWKLITKLFSFTYYLDVSSLHFKWSFIFFKSMYGIIFIIITFILYCLSALENLIFMRTSCNVFKIKSYQFLTLPL